MKPSQYDMLYDGTDSRSQSTCTMKRRNFELEYDQ